MGAGLVAKLAQVDLQLRDGMTRQSDRVRVQALREGAHHTGWQCGIQYRQKRSIGQVYRPLF